MIEYLSDANVYELIKTGTMTLEQFKEWVDKQADNYYNRGLCDAEIFDPLDD